MDMGFEKKIEKLLKKVLDLMKVIGYNKFKS